MDATQEAHDSVAVRFYRAFQQRDAETMETCYADNATFSDPVFPDLSAPRVRAMWRMLCERGKDLKIDFKVLREDERSALVHWRASYTFVRTQRHVENRITAELTIDKGLITRHIDRFGFWRWSRQAFGVPGILLGWTPLLRSKVQRVSGETLAAFIANADG